MPVGQQEYSRSCTCRLLTKVMDFRRGQGRSIFISMGRKLSAKGFIITIRVRIIRPAMEKLSERPNKNSERLDTLICL